MLRPGGLMFRLPLATAMFTLAGASVIRGQDAPPPPLSRCRLVVSLTREFPAPSADSLWGPVGADAGRLVVQRTWEVGYTSSLRRTLRAVVAVGARGERREEIPAVGEAPVRGGLLPLDGASVMRCDSLDAESRRAVAGSPSR